VRGGPVPSNHGRHHVHGLRGGHLPPDVGRRVKWRLCELRLGQLRCERGSQLCKLHIGLVRRVGRGNLHAVRGGRLSS
jgi:hypothetical protein